MLRCLNQNQFGAIIVCMAPVWKRWFLHQGCRLFFPIRSGGKGVRTQCRQYGQKLKSAWCDNLVLFVSLMPLLTQCRLCKRKLKINGYRHIGKKTWVPDHSCRSRLTIKKANTAKSIWFQIFLFPCPYTPQFGSNSCAFYSRLKVWILYQKKEKKVFTHSILHWNVVHLKISCIEMNMWEQTRSAPWRILFYRPYAYGILMQKCYLA